MEKMATNKSHNKSPVFKMGQMWHTIDDCTAADEDDPEEEDVIKDNETMKLRREDMSLFGICPAWDQFYLVVCEYCQQVIKPQALQKHIELRHSYHKNNSNNQMNHSLKVRTDSTNTTTNTPSIRRSSSTTTATTATKITENGSDINDFENDIKSEIFANNVAETDVKLESCSADVQTSPDYVNDSTPSESVTTIDTSCVKSELSETEDMTSKLTSKLIDILSPINSTTVPLLPEPTGPGPGPGFATIVSADSESVTISVPDVEFSPNSSIVKDPVVPTVPTVTKPAPKKKSYKKSTNPRKLLPCKDREYDANKHCGVCLPDMERPCTRSLTCKTHSLTLRRAVQGRIKNFDELLAEHREAKEAALRAQGIEVKPTKKAIQKQQQQLKASQQLQLKEEQNQQLMSDKSISSQPLIPISRTLMLSESQTQTVVSNINTNSNSLLSFVSSPVISHSDSVVVREPVSVAPRSQLRLDQIEVDSDGSMWMRCHPRPASVCNFNVRTLNGSRLVSRNNDLTLAALRSTFNSPMLVSKLTNNQKCSSTHTLSPIAIKSPLRNSNQTFIANKKLCVSLDSESVESSSDSGIDPYNFADGLTNSNNFTYVKPKTTVSKSTTYASKKKKKSDINCSTYNSSLLSNGQIFHTTNAKTIGSNPKKKSVLKKNCNISQVSSIGNTIAVSDSPLMASDSTTVSTNCEPLLNPSTSLSGQVPQRNLNDILSNSIDSNRSDNGSILLNGSLLSCKRNTLNALSKQTNSDIKDSFSPKTISPAKSPNSNNINNNRFLLNSPPLTTITSGLSINANSRPLLQRQILPSNTINSNLNSSQNVSQISQSLQNTTHAIFIKSAKQSLQNQFIPITSPQLLSKTEDYTS